MRPLRISEDEFRALLVGELEIMDDAEFDRARKMASRLRIPLERAVVERSRVPLGFILGHIAEAWSVGFVDLKVSDVKARGLADGRRRVCAQQSLAAVRPEGQRLLDMGVEPFLLASTLALAVAQRLVRRICLSCRESAAPEASILETLRARPDFDQTIRVLQSEGVLGQAGDSLSSIRLFHGSGCVQCHGSGFRGRTAVFELFEINDRIRAMIMERRDASSIRAEVIGRGMKTMFQDGLAKALLGETTLEEVFRVAL